MKKLMIFGLVGVFLGGCAVHNTGFECKSSKGQSCTSVSKVNRMIDLGLITDEEEQAQEEAKKKPAPAKTKPKRKKASKKKGVDIWIAGNDREDEKFI